VAVIDVDEITMITASAAAAVDSTVTSAVDGGGGNEYLFNFNGQRLNCNIIVTTRYTHSNTQLNRYYSQQMTDFTPSG